MSRSPFDPRFEDLPDVLAIFPLPGALLLPGGRLPLNIFEPRYLNMVHDAITGARLIAMVQPREAAEDPGAAPIYRTGCAGRIVAFSETDDGRYLITLAGLIRFDVAEELAETRGYRRVRPDYTRFGDDLRADPGEIDRPALMKALHDYFEINKIEGDWSAIEKAPDESLVTSLAMACPFEDSEKQALLEAMTLAERAEILTTILNMAALETRAGTPRR